MPFFRLREWRSVVLPLASASFCSWRSLRRLTWFGVQRGIANAAVQRTLDIELRLSRVLSLMQDAETGQRGYLLTGDEAYLQPYEEAVAPLPRKSRNCATLIGERPEQIAHIAALKKLIDDKFAELALTIERRRAGAMSEALAAVGEGAGRRLMDRIRAIMVEMRAVQGGLLLQQQANVETANVRMQFGTIAAFLLLLGVAGFALVKVQQQTLGLIARKQ